MRFRTFHRYPAMVDIFSKVADQERAVFLDSSKQNALGRYSVIAFAPWDTVRKQGKGVYANDEVVKETFSEALQRLLEKHKKDYPAELFLSNPAIGFLSYGYGQELMDVSSRHPNRFSIDDAIFCFYHVYLVEDHEAHCLQLVLQGEDESDAKMDELVAFLLTDAPLQDASHDASPQSALQAAPPTPAGATKQYGYFTTSDYDAEGYMAAIQKLIAYIVQGHTYIANMTRRLEIQSNVPPFPYYRVLREKNPAPFAAYMNYGAYQILSSSPEQFLYVQDGNVRTKPIKGTRKKTQDAAVNQAMIEDLLHSPKERSELLMVTDLERNDLNKVCVPGTVKVPQMYTLEEHETVYHMVNTVTGKLAPQKNLLDLIQATFPGGSITGTPKKRTMEIIDELENSPRHIYTGSLGYLTPDGQMNLNIIIRTLLHQEDRYEIGVGGGITCESDPAEEFEETVQKAKALVDTFSALAAPEGESGV
ncbi:anthranilate synthase component I family protein [Levyella massiliensis]|uniref:anthranilate synthase component I family protein n=1 Tax=Levyella massiliensis TaxID=938289 RepID=UPI003999FCD8